MTQEPNPYTITLPANASATKYCGRIWFVIASLVGFLGLLFTYHGYNTGQVVIVCPLWQYYLIEARNGFPSLTTAKIGGYDNAIVATMAIHLGISALVGLTVSAVRWGVRRVQKTFRTQTNSQHN